VSRDLLDGLEGLELSDESETYEAGLEYEHQGLAGRIVDDWVERRFKEIGYDGIGKHVLIPLYESLLEPIENFAHRPFLDAVVTSLWMREPEGSFLRIAMAKHLIDPLIQALYNLGHNDFDLTLPPYLDKPLGYSLGTLKGTRGRPLELTVRTPFIQQLGCGAQYCKITLHGNAEYPGSGFARYSEFICEDAVEGVGKYPVEYCTFRVPTSDCISHVGDAKHSQFYVSERVSMNEWLRFKQGSLFKDSDTFCDSYRNRLFEPDGKEGWREVTF